MRRILRRAAEDAGFDPPVAKSSDAHNAARKIDIFGALGVLGDQFLGESMPAGASSVTSRTP
jgi:hypothetical protein